MNINCLVLSRQAGLFAIKLHKKAPCIFASFSISSSALLFSLYRLLFFVHLFLLFPRFKWEHFWAGTALPFDTEALISYFCFASFASLKIYKPCQVLFSTLRVLLDLFPLSEYLRPLRFLPTVSVSYKRYKMSASVSVIRIYDGSNSYLSRKSQHAFRFSCSVVWTHSRKAQKNPSSLPHPNGKNPKLEIWLDRLIYVHLFWFNERWLWWAEGVRAGLHLRSRADRRWRRFRRAAETSAAFKLKMILFRYWIKVHRFHAELMLNESST